jgi:trimeric autotransporter adhesin
MNKFIVVLITMLCTLQGIFAQVGIGTTTPNPSAKLDVVSTNSGLLMPRMSSLQRTNIPSPAIGLQVFDTDTKSFWFYTGILWKELSIGSNGWNLTGNAATDPATNFIGTTDDQPLRLRVNGSWAGELHPSSFNVAFGVGAGKSMTGGQANVAIGENALTANTDGNFNVATGYQALSVNTTGIDNTAVGANALISNTTASSNTAVGRNALFANVTGIQNTAVGKDALLANTANNMTAVGYQALTANTSGFENTVVGSGSMKANTTGSQNTAMGGRSLTSNTSGNGNVAIGDNALFSNTTGTTNVGIGNSALFDNTIGTSNVAVGALALTNNVFGNNNTAVGTQTMNTNTNGANNVAVGREALGNNDLGNANTGVGMQALLNNISGGFNTAAGYHALLNNTLGTGNTAIGYSASENQTTASFNVSIGPSANINNVTGGSNIAIGEGSGSAPGFTALGNTIGIGNSGGFQHGASNQVVIGNSSMLVIGGKVGWSVISDQRVKRNIRENVKGLDFIMKLRPVTYNISNDAITALTRSKESPDFPGKRDGEKVTYTGFLAQEVEQAAITSGYDFSGYTKPLTANGFYTIRYAEFVVPLVKAMQEQQAVIDAQDKKIVSLEKRLAALEAKK